MNVVWIYFLYFHWGYQILLCYLQCSFLFKLAAIRKILTKTFFGGFGVGFPQGIPGYGLRTEMIRKFFPFPLWKKFRNSRIPERFLEQFFSVNRKFPECCSGIPDWYGIPEFPERYGTFRKFLECSGISFRKFTGKIVPEISRIKLKLLRLM